MSQRAHEALPDATLVDWLAIASDRRMGACWKRFGRAGALKKSTRSPASPVVPLRFRASGADGAQHRGPGVSPAELTEEELRLWKSHGFSDAHIADALAGFPPEG